MKRWTMRITVLLILGAIVNVLVAWGLAYRPDRSQLTWRPTAKDAHVCRESDEYTLHIHVVRQFGEEKRSYSRYRADPSFDWSPISSGVLDTPGFRVELLSWTTQPVAVPTLYEQANGWPSLSLGFAYTTDRQTVQGGDSRGRLTLPEWTRIQSDPSNNANGMLTSVGTSWSTRTRLPYVPIWSGFLMNTVFYALLLAVPFYGVGATRRAFRRWRGRCPRCAYPVGTSPVCTECERPVR